jgi:hypothetical protein
MVATGAPWRWSFVEPDGAEASGERGGRHDNTM